MSRDKNWFLGEAPEGPVLYLEGHAVDGQTLARQVGKLIHFLRANAIGEGHTVALSSASSWLVTLMLRTSAELGVKLFPIDPRLPLSQQQSLLEKSSVDFLLSYEIPVPQELDTDGLSNTDLRKEGSAKPMDSDLALVIATSGSSGDPKGVMLGWEAIHSSARVANRQLGLDSSGCWLNCLPLHHIGGLSIIFRTALVSASMVLHQGFDAADVWRDIQRYRVSHLSLVPVMLAKLLDAAEGAPPETLKVVLIGGAALDESLAQRALAAGWPLFVTYGMSEAASQVATRRLSSAAEINAPLPLLEGMSCSVVDEEGNVTDGLGRIRLRGDMLMRGYANLQQSGGEGMDEAGWFTTGDMGSYSEANGLQVVGRADEVIISGGENIHPHQVEHLLHDCPCVDELCVLGVEDPEWGEKVCAVYVGDGVEQEVETWCRENIDGPLRPRLFVRLAQLPRLSNGKLDRQALKGLCRA